MISNELLKAREYEAEKSAEISETERPLYHFSPRIGWLNDPNGFSFYNGKYHLFYQYHPFSTYWGPMHWGHAVSDDLISWEYLPAAMAPDTEYDGVGCFSGSAVTLSDGRQLLIYTGCSPDGTDDRGRWPQTQCLAVSSTAEDGSMEYVKYEGNPVITGADLPEGGDIYEFRDPYIWKTADGYRAIVANANIEGGAATQLTLYRSADAFTWEFDKVLFEDSRKLGVMWECPNFFELDGKHVLIASPMDMEAEEAEGSVRFPKGNNVCYIVGEYDAEAEIFIPHQTAAHEKARGGQYATYHPVDCGLDFYAPQVMETPDGRHVMIAWMQDPHTGNLHDEDAFRIFGQMTVPRELSIRGGRLIQQPIRELEAYRTGQPVRESLSLESEKKNMPELSGRNWDIELEISPESVSQAGTCSLDEIALSWAENEEFRTVLSYRPDSSVITIDRSTSGWPGEISGKRSVRVRDRGGRIDLRVLLDRYSAEIFVNGGEQVISLTQYTPLWADGISLKADGSAHIELTAHRLG